MPSAKRSTKRKTRSTPAKRRAASARAKRGAGAKRSTTATRRPKGLRCPDCDFVARHPMGLGRHRSARHGVPSQRQRRRESSGAWLTRREAARRAGVHYNTIRHWEQSGRLRRSKSAGTRGALVSAIDLEALANRGKRGSIADGVDGQRIQALERRFNDLLDGLDRLVSSARGPRPARRGPGRPRRS